MAALLKKLLSVTADGRNMFFVEIILISLTNLYLCGIIFTDTYLFNISISTSHADVYC